MHGHAQIVEGDEARAVLARYAERFPRAAGATLAQPLAVVIDVDVQPNSP
jgi:hypothetical protein